MTAKERIIDKLERRHKTSMDLVLTARGLGNSWAEKVHYERARAYQDALDIVKKEMPMG